MAVAFAPAYENRGPPEMEGQNMLRRLAAIMMIATACSCATEGREGELVEPSFGEDGKLDVNSGVNILAELTFGEPVTGAFERDLDFFGYTFTAASGAAVSAEVTQRGTARDLDTTLFVFGPRDQSGEFGERIALDDDSGWGRHSKVSDLALAEDGVYLIVLGTHNAAGRGHYQLVIECQNDACVQEPVEPELQVVEDLFNDAASGVLACLLVGGSVGYVDETGECEGEEGDVNIWTDETDHLFQTSLEQWDGEDYGSSFHYTTIGQVVYRRDAMGQWGYADGDVTEQCMIEMRASFSDEDASLELLSGPDCHVVAPASSECADRLASRLAPVTEDLLYMSEGDYPFLHFAQATASEGTITPELILEEVLWRTSTEYSWVSDFEEWIADYADEGYGYEEDAERYQQMREIIREELSDTVVISLDEVQVKLFVIGRTACGELAGLRTVSIET